MQFVVLLRGVNVGSTKRIGMADLRDGLEQAGFAGVRTLLQSGNVVLTDEGAAQEVEERVRDVLTSRFSLGVDVVVRDEHAVRAVVADNPLEGVATDGSRQFVIFCSQPHDPARLPPALAPERLECRPMELHAWCPDGMRDSKFMIALARRPPAPVVTVRNWNTVVKLAGMLDG